MSDYVLLSAAWMLNQQVNTYDLAGNLLPPDGAYQQRGAEIVWTFGEFMAEHGLLRQGVNVARRQDFEIRMLDLTDEGKAFAIAHLDKWASSLDRQGQRAVVDGSKLEKRLAAFRKAGS